MIDIPATKRGDRVLRFLLAGRGSDAGKLMENDGGTVDAILLAFCRWIPWLGGVSKVEQLRLINNLWRDFRTLVASKERKMDGE